MTCVLGLAGPATAAASGFSVARFGGEHGHPTTDNATSLYYNPGGIALAEGTHVFVDATAAVRWASYSRPGSAVNSQTSLDLAPGANDGEATLLNFIASPFVGITSDFGTDFMAAGAAVYFPFGGQADWDKNQEYAGSEDFPGAVDGPQRWYTINGSLRSMYITGGLGFDIEKIGLSLGVTGSAIRTEVNTIRARNADGTDDLVIEAPDGELILKEGRSAIDVSGWQGGFGVGAVWRWKERLWIGASYTSQPNVHGGMTLEGKLDNVLAISQPETTPVEVTQTLPDIIRLGIRGRPLENLELRLFGDWTRWSVFDRQCVLDANEPDRKCDFGDDSNALEDPGSYGGPQGEDTRGVTQHLVRFWRDGFGVRAGASYWFLEPLEAYLGVGYDSSAVPVETLDPALMDMHKMTVSLGARWQVIKYLALALTATEVIYFTVDTEGENIMNDFQAPTRQASADGVYKQFIQVFNLYADVSF